MLDIIEQIKIRSQQINMVGGSITIYGGAAMLFHQMGEGRMTRDIDAAFGPDQEILQIIKDISENNK
ncbi:hypothetical protein FACS1894166_07500 [Bacilli bacterium]|nr:hypothetical protein FACS1894166_07500 [Bacilli bacterium]